MEIVLALGIGALAGSGVWLILRPRTFQVIIGLSLLSYAVNLFIIAMGRLTREAPPLLKLADLHAAREVAARLARALPTNLAVRDWTRTNRNWFDAVQLEKRLMFIILTLIVAVAAFNLVSTLVMTVTDKRADIAILRTLGAAPRDMIGIFMTQGSVIGVVGTVAGLLLGLLIAANVTAITSGLERLMGVTLVDPRVYFIAELPADVRGSEVLVIAAVALALGVLATLYPAWRAATTQPAESLRHEV